MTVSQLPVEVWEHVIDLYAQGDAEGGVGVTRRTLLACALTCKAWTVRSLINLHRFITLRSDEQARYLVSKLRDPDRLALQVERIAIQMSPYSTACHIVPLLLCSVPRARVDVTTVEITSPRAPGRASAILGTVTHDSVLKAYSSYRSVHTLNIYTVHFDTFSYLGRLILCFRSLRHLLLSDVTVTTLGDDSFSFKYAKRKGLKLLSFSAMFLAEPEFSVLSRWLVRSRALRSLESLSVITSPYGNSSVVTISDVNDIITSAGESLRYLDLRGPGIDEDVECGTNVSLRSVTLNQLTSNQTQAILSSIPMRNLIVLELNSIRLDTFEDIVSTVNHLIVNLPVLSNLKRLVFHVQLSWRRGNANSLFSEDASVRKAEKERRQALRIKVEQELERLRDSFGELLDEEIWS